MRRLLHRFRNTRRHAVLGAVMGVVVAGLSAVGAQERGQEHLSKAGEVDRDIVLRDHAGWDRNCEAVPHPAVQLDAPPLHGIVCTRIDDVTIQYLSYGTQAQCIGRVVRGLRLIYRPHAGYAGADMLRYSVQYPKARRDVSVSVTVTSPPATSGAASSRIAVPVSQRQQPPGVIPPCGDFVS